jgi:penicillin V acylase-like amidase (Ntn superfamily)
MTFLSKLMMATLMTSTALATAAGACSRLAKPSDHGVAYVRSVDWGKKTGMDLVTFGVGDDVTTYTADGYTAQADGNARNFTVAWVENNAFHGVQAQAFNDKGMVADTLYMSVSADFIGAYEDTDAPAVNLADAPGYLVAMYDTAPQIAAAYEAGEFQLAWSADLGAAGQHGVHVSAVDANGDVTLFQVNEGGKVMVYTGNVQDSDLGVKANAPLLQEHRANIAQFNAEDGKTAANVPADISSPSRHLRLAWLNQNITLEGMSKAEALGTVQNMYDSGASVPAQVIDPTIGDTYTTWQTSRTILGDDVVTVRDFSTAAEISYSITDAKIAHELNGGQVCADAMVQANEGRRMIEFTPCQPGAGS